MSKKFILLIVVLIASVLIFAYVFNQGKGTNAAASVYSCKVNMVLAQNRFP